MYRGNQKRTKSPDIRALYWAPGTNSSLISSANLDSASGAELIALLQSLNRERGITVVMVTHDPDIARSTQRIVYLRDGRITHEEPVDSPRLEASAAAA